MTPLSLLCEMLSQGKEIKGGAVEDKKLLPCPFCGSDSINDTTFEREKWNSDDNCVDGFDFIAVCPECIVSQVPCGTLEEMIEQWNHRAEIKDSDNTSHNKAMDEICPKCGDDGRIGGSEDPNSGIPCPVCKSGKLHHS